MGDEDRPKLESMTSTENTGFDRLFARTSRDLQYTLDAIPDVLASRSYTALRALLYDMLHHTGFLLAILHDHALAQIGGGSELTP
jgi:hypothetical protein